MEYSLKDEKEVSRKNQKAGGKRQEGEKRVSKVHLIISRFYIMMLV